MDAEKGLWIATWLQGAYEWAQHDEKSTETHRNNCKAYAYQYGIDIHLISKEEYERKEQEYNNKNEETVNE